MKPTARRRLGKYVLLGRLGAGGMGKIYLAHAPGPAGIDKLLVVKRLHGHLTNDPVLVNSFLDEARLSMALTHPNIVHTYDVGELDGRYFMVMEYIDGQNLGVVLRMAKRSGQYPKSSTWAGMFLSVLDALHAAHTAKDARGRPLHIIHRDVSPQNVIITYDGTPKLVDFGIAKAAMRVSETDAGTLKGKYAYMSPEQVRGDDLDARSDVFAAGIVLWEMLAGRRLYKADTIVRSVERIMNEPVVSPTRVNPQCHPGLAAIAGKALQKRREDRYASAAAMKDALEDALEATGTRFRLSKTRDLMHWLFHDVIDKQRAVLDATLSRAADDGAPPADEDEEDSRRNGDSESDLRMPRMPSLSLARDSTTPSAARRSPLVTDDGAKVLAPPKDDIPAPPRKRDAAPRETPSPVTVSTGPVAASNQPSALLAPPLEAHAGSDGDTLTTDAPPKRRAAPVVLFVASAALAVGLVVFATRDGAPPDDVPPDDVPVPAPLAVALAAEPPIDAPPPVEAPPPAPPPPDPLPEDAPPPAPAPVIEEVPDAPPKRPTRRLPRRPEPPKEPPKEEAAVVEQGFLTLDTVPWTTVYLGKKKLGETPLVKVPVPAGALELTLVNADEGVREGYLARVKPGEVFRTRLDLR